MNLVIFDLDGVLIDAQPIHRETFERALEEVAPSLAIRARSYRPTLEGRPTRVKLRILGVSEEHHERIFRRKQDLTLAAAREYGFDVVRADLVARLRARGVSVACYTNSIRETAAMFLDSAGVKVDFLLTNEDVTNPKPDPEGYLKVMARFGARPDQTVIVEDSDVGLAAAEASGAQVVAVRGVKEVGMDLFQGVRFAR